MGSTNTDRRQGVNSSKAIKVPCATYTSGNITLSGEQTINGVTTNASRVLVMDQTNAVENGIYDSDTGSWTRSLDFDDDMDVCRGTIVPVVIGGTTTFFNLTTASPVPGSTALAFAQTQVPGSTQVSVKTYGAVGDGAHDDTAAIQAAVNAVGETYFPDGTYKTTATITVPNGKTLVGSNQKTAIINYTGTGNAFLNQNPVDGSGYGQVQFRTMTIIGPDDGTSTGAGIALNAGGFAFYEIDRVRIVGFKYPLVLDQAEVSHVHSSIFETSTGTACVWITNGNEWRGSGSAGYTNVITLDDCQLNGGTYGLIDDGGNCHTISNNNFNGNGTPAHIAGVESLTLNDNSFETQQQVASANVGITSLGIGGGTKGPCVNGVIHGNSFGGHMLAGSCLAFGGDWHTAFHIAGNRFGSLLGRGGAIDVTKLRNSFCGFNRDEGTAGMVHYSGTHNDTDGNVLFPPNKDAVVSDHAMAYTFGDSGRPVDFKGNITLPSGAWVPTDQSGAGLSLTVTDARYMKIADNVLISADIAYPVTADGSNAKLGGLPFSSLNSGANQKGGGATSWNNVGTAITLAVLNNSTFIAIYNAATGAGILNSALSGKEFNFSFFYKAAS